MRNRRKSRRQNVNSDALRRSVRYLGNYRKQALLPYIFLVIATLSMLAVPRMTSNIIDGIMDGYTADVVLNGLKVIPEAMLDQALPTILEALDLPATWSSDELSAYMTEVSSDAPRAILMAGIAIVVFAAFLLWVM